MTKPFSVRELILRVKAILKRNTKTSNLSNQTHEINRNFGSLKMNIESHEIFINDEEIILTALEFKLLRQLVERRGRLGCFEESSLGNSDTHMDQR